MNRRHHNNIVIIILMAALTQSISASTTNRMTVVYITAEELAETTIASNVLVSVTDSRHDLRIGDGSTMGGIRIMRTDCLTTMPDRVERDFYFQGHDINLDGEHVLSADNAGSVHLWRGTTNIWTVIATTSSVDVVDTEIDDTGTNLLISLSAVALFAEPDIYYSASLTPPSWTSVTNASYIWPPTGTVWTVSCPIPPGDTNGYFVVRYSDASVGITFGVPVRVPELWLGAVITNITTNVTASGVGELMTASAVQAAVGGGGVSETSTLAAVSLRGASMAVPLVIEASNAINTNSNTLIIEGGPLGLIAIGMNVDVTYNVNAGIGIGNNANGSRGGTAVGHDATAYQGAAVGIRANGDEGAAVGKDSKGAAQGAAVGQLANGDSSGSAIGYGANGSSYGAAMGRNAQASTYGVAVGYLADASNLGVAIGVSSDGPSTNIAIGRKAQAWGTDGPSIAIGVMTSNSIPDSVRVRGTLYLDGGTGVLFRSTFGTGTFGGMTYDGTNLFLINATGGTEQVTSL